MSAYGVYNLIQADKLAHLANIVSAVSLEGFDGRKEPFNELIHLVRPHNGQLATAAHMLELLENGYAAVTKYSVGFMAFSKELIRKIGWWDERYYGGG